MKVTNFSAVLLMVVATCVSSSSAQRDDLDGVDATYRQLIDFADEQDDMPHIPVLPSGSNNTNSTTTASPTLAPTHADGTTDAPVPIIPVPPGNHTHNHSMTDAPTATPTSESNKTSAPTPTPGPTPTPAPTKHYVPPDQHTDAPTASPTSEEDKHPNKESAGLSFLRMIGRMFAWCILMGLGVLFYGFCINHRYQIAYYLRHAGHCCKIVSEQVAYRCQRLLARLRGNDGEGTRYAPLYPEDATSNNLHANLLFDPPMGDMGESQDGFVFGQHSNVQFQNMG